MYDRPKTVTSLIYLSRVLWHVSDDALAWNLVWEIFKQECTYMNLKYDETYDLLLSCNTVYGKINYE